MRQTYDRCLLFPRKSVSCIRTSDVCIYVAQLSSDRFIVAVCRRDGSVLERRIAPTFELRQLGVLSQLQNDESLLIIFIHHKHGSSKNNKYN